MNNQQFTIGQKVRFRQNGEFGIMNKYMYANNVMLGKEYEVTDITGGVARIIGYNLYFDVPLGCIELIPEPQSKFANITEGQYVEIEESGVSRQERVVLVNVQNFSTSQNFTFDLDGNILKLAGRGTLLDRISVIRIVPAKEVKLKLELKESTVAAGDNMLCGYLILSGVNTGVNPEILSDKSRAEVNALLEQIKVESLLKAQEEE